MILALISQVKGSAIFELKKRFYVLEINSLNEPRLIDELSAKILIRDVIDLEYLEVEDIAAIRTHLLIRKIREELLRAALILLDSKRSTHLKSLAADWLKSSYKFDEWAWVEGVLFSCPLPEGSDPLGAASWKTPMSSFFNELAEAQDQIKTLYLAWNNLPEQLFTTETKEQVRAKVVRNGVFRALLKGNSKKESTPFYAGLASNAEQRRSVNRNIRDNYDIFISHSEIKKTASNYTWSVLPWRLAWFETKWSQIETSLAYTTAHKWLEENFASSLEDLTFHLLESKKAHLFESWQAQTERNAPALKTVHLLCNQIKDWEHPHELENTTSYLERDRKRLGPYVMRLIKDFFGAMPLPEDDKSNFSDVISAESVRAALTYESQIDNEFNLIKDNPDISKAPLNQKPHETKKHLDEFREIIGTYALDKTFRRGGFIIVINTHKSSKWKLPKPHASLLNLHAGRTKWFDGYMASILEKLQKRLLADLKSGVPTEHCGWTSLTDLEGKTNEPSSASKLISDIHQHISGAGFSSDTLQTSYGDVRLNPALAMPSVLAGPLTLTHDY